MRASTQYRRGVYARACICMAHGRHPGTGYIKKISGIKWNMGAEPLASAGPLAASGKGDYCQWLLRFVFGKEETSAEPGRGVGKAVAARMTLYPGTPGTQTRKVTALQPNPVLPSLHRAKCIG
jgi:hypothetical protein